MQVQYITLATGQFYLHTFRMYYKCKIGIRLELVLDLVCTCTLG